MEDVIITIPQFITHVEKKKTKKITLKKKESPYFKIGGNAFYSQEIKYYERSHITKIIHAYLNGFIPKGIETISYPVIFQIEFHVPINYGGISIRYNEKKFCYDLSWSKPGEDYKPNYDLDNLQQCWIKWILDHLRGNNRHVSTKKVLIDDNVWWVRGIESRVHFIENLEDRKIIIRLKKLNDNPE